MKSLSIDWLTEGLFDVEYKTYVLLAYLSEIKKNFNQQKLFPDFSDLVQHYHNLLAIKNGRDQLKQSFPKELNAADWQNLQLEFKEKFEENDFFGVMDEIIAYSIPAMQTHLTDGKDLYQMVATNIVISPVGLASLNTQEGYFFLMAPPKNLVKIYRYNTSQLHLPDGPYRSLHVSHLHDIQLGYANTLESIKIDLLRKTQSQEFPATYLIESNILVPWDESLLPVAKRSFVEYLTKSNP